MNDSKKWKYNGSTFFFKVGLSGMVDWKSESQTELKSESYISGSIDSKMGGINNVSYSQTSESCKLLKNIYKKSHKHCGIWELYEIFCKYKLQIIRMFEQPKYWKFASKEKIYKIWVV